MTSLKTRQPFAQPFGLYPEKPRTNFSPKQAIKTQRYHTKAFCLSLATLWIISSENPTVGFTPTIPPCIVTTIPPFIVKNLNIHSPLFLVCSRRIRVVTRAPLLVGAHERFDLLSKYCGICPRELLNNLAVSHEEKRRHLKHLVLLRRFLIRYNIIMVARRELDITYTWYVPCVLN